jgi:uncharacterized phiE125 gp8 family phage protein
MKTLSLITAPVLEPVSLSEVRAHLRLSGNLDDQRLVAIAIGARQWVEQQTGLCLIEQTWAWSLPDWPTSMGDWVRGVALPLMPVSAVTGVTYVDTFGATVTLPTSIYSVQIQAGRADPRPAYVVTKYGCVLPPVRPQAGAVTVTFKAGFGADPTAVPHALALAVLQRAASGYDGSLDETLVLQTLRPFMVSGVA